MTNNSLRTDDDSLWLVYQYGEVPILSNVLMALARYKRVVGYYWPRRVAVRRGNRLDIGLGNDVVVQFTDWMLADALYMSLYQPYVENHGGKRTHTPKPTYRTAVGERIGRQRRNVG